MNEIIERLRLRMRGRMRTNGNEMGSRERELQERNEERRNDLKEMYRGTPDEVCTDEQLEEARALYLAGKPHTVLHG